MARNKGFLVAKVYIIKSKINFDKKTRTVFNKKNEIITKIFKQNYKNFELSMLKYTNFGQPYLLTKNGKKIYCSFSYSNNYCVIGISENRLGIDIETNKKVNGIIKKYFFKNSNVDFLREWTFREAFSKLLGKGIDEDFFHITKASLLNYYVKTINNDNYVLTAVSFDNIVQFYHIEIREGD